MEQKYKVEQIFTKNYVLTHTTKKDYCQEAGLDKIMFTTKDN